MANAKQIPTLREKESHAKASKTFSSLRFTWITFQARGGMSPSESDGGALQNYCSS